MKLKQVLAVLLGLLFLTAGILHFTSTEFYVRIMPPYVPLKVEMVYLSGILEVVGGAAVLCPRLRMVAGYGLVALLLAVFPANIHMAFNSSEFPSIHPAILWMRLPLQFLLIAWVWYCADLRLPRGSGSRSGNGSS